MKWLSAGLTFVNFATVSALVLGIVGGGLNQTIAFSAVLLGVFAGIAAYLGTNDPGARLKTVDSQGSDPPRRKRSSIWLWIVCSVFAIFAFRCFCWLLFNDSEELKIQSPNNLGDLALHITYIRNFASGVTLWPDNPIYVFSHLRYPAGMDLFNALLVLLRVDLAPGLIWVGLLASTATCYAFFRWGGTFGIAGFLFNGGIAGFRILDSSNFLKFIDYQSEKIAWKSIPLSMFVTQRGLLYAIPAGLLLLWHWREKFFKSSAQNRAGGPLPFWVELSLYASMPLFHVHTFLALTVVLVFLFAFDCLHKLNSISIKARWHDFLNRAHISSHIALLVVFAVIPATFFVALITDFFQASSVLKLHPGWVMFDPEFRRSSPFAFWWVNFGLWLPLVALLIGLCAWRAFNLASPSEKKLPENLSFLIPAAAIFVIGLFVQTAPWGWDNLKLMFWGYFIVLPYLWTDLIALLSLPIRVGLCLALFGSGFVSLFGGLAAGPFTFANRGEVDWVGVAVHDVPVEARFAAYPTYNHPLLLQGRKVALGYPGHLWTQGFNDYGKAYQKLQNLMEGKGNWRQTARELRVRYIFWGREEKTNYPTSTRPWENGFAQVRSDPVWGTIYDLDSPIGSTK